MTNLTKSAAAHRINAALTKQSKEKMHDLSERPSSGSQDEGDCRMIPWLIYAALTIVLHLEAPKTPLVLLPFLMPKQTPQIVTI